MRRLLKVLAILIITFSIIITYNSYSQGYNNAQKKARDANGDGEVTVDELVDYYNEDETRTVLAEDIQKIVEEGKVDELDDEAIMAANNTVNSINKADPNQDYSWVTKFEKEIQSRDLYVTDSSGGQTTYGEETKASTTKSYKDQGYNTNKQGEIRDLDKDGTVTASEIIDYIRSDEKTDSLNINDIKIIVEGGGLGRLTDEELKSAKEILDRPQSKQYLTNPTTGARYAWVQRFETAYENTFGTDEDEENDNDGKLNRTNTAGTADEIMNAANNWLQGGETAIASEELLNEQLFRTTIEQAYNILLAIGFVVIIGAGAVLAIQFMLASVDQKAVIKQKILPYITGTCVIFGAFGIWGTIIRLLGDPSGVSQYSNINDLGSVEDADTIRDLGNNIIGIIQIVGSFVAIVMLIILGIRYMTGSVEEKAEYKVTMKNYFIGAILLFGITNFIAIVQVIAEQVLT